MNEFRLLARRDGWIMANYFLEIKHNPKRLGVYFLYLLWIGALVFNMVARYRNPTEIQAQLGSQIIGAGFTGLAAAFFLYSLYHSTLESSTFFTMGDLHLLFPTPVSPKKVLLYSMVKQSLSHIFLYSFFILALMPLILNITKVNLQHFPFLYLGFISLLLVVAPLNFLVFAIGSKYGLHRRLQQAVLALIAVFTLYLAWSIIASGDLWQGLLQGLNAPWLCYLPVIGWGKVVFMTAVTGYSAWSTIGLVLQFLFLAGCIILSYRTADDYYEDTLKATAQRALRRKQRAGIGKKRGFSPTFSRKNLSIPKMGSGPWAFLWRSKVEYSRSDFHPYLGFWALIFLLAGIAVGIFAAKGAGGLTAVYTTNGIIAYIIFFFSASNATQHELAKPYIFLIPASNLLKIVGSNLADILRMSANILALNIPLGILLKVPLPTIIIMIVFGVSFYILNLGANFLTRIIFRNTLDQKALYPLFLMLQVLLLLLPGAVVGGVLAFLFQNPALVFAGIAVVNIIIIGILLLLSNKLFARLEWT
ncbi:MAG TPA: hypothetical protein GXZ24_02070 [Firmicutes bacterium]|nr:hypothetical protein [Bacillota bacterium]